jgi:hypothetical protein
MKLNRDPAAITSLSVACRYASRPPSSPVLNFPIKNPVTSRVLLLLGLVFPLYRTSFHFHAIFNALRLATCRLRATFLSRDGNRLSQRGDGNTAADASVGVRGSVNATKFVTSGVTFSVLLRHPANDLTHARFRRSGHPDKFFRSSVNRSERFGRPGERATRRRGLRR